MEWWNTGVLVYERMLSIFYYIENEKFAMNQYSIIANPIFHFSNIPTL